MEQLPKAALKQIEHGEEILELLRNLTDALPDLDTNTCQFRRKSEPIGESDLTIGLQEKINQLLQYDDSEVWRAINDLITEKITIQDMNNYRLRSVKIRVKDLAPDVIDLINGSNIDIGDIIDASEVMEYVRIAIDNVLNTKLDEFRRKDVKIIEDDLDTPIVLKLTSIGNLNDLHPDLAREFASTGGNVDLVSLINFLYLKCDGSHEPQPPVDPPTIYDFGHASSPVTNMLDMGKVSSGVNKVIDINSEKIDDILN